MPLTCQALYRRLLGMSHLITYHPWPEAFHLLWELATPTLTRTRCERRYASRGRKCQVKQVRRGPFHEVNEKGFRQEWQPAACRACSDLQVMVHEQHWAEQCPHGHRAHLLTGHIGSDITIRKYVRQMQVFVNATKGMSFRIRIGLFYAGAVREVLSQREGWNKRQDATSHWKGRVRVFQAEKMQTRALRPERTLGCSRNGNKASVTAGPRTRRQVVHCQSLKRPPGPESSLDLILNSVRSQEEWLGLGELSWTNLEKWTPGQGGSWSKGERWEGAWWTLGTVRIVNCRKKQEGKARTGGSPVA